MEQLPKWFKNSGDEIAIMLNGEEDYIGNMATDSDTDKAILAYNSTYGAGICPEAVPDLLKALKDILSYAENHQDRGPAGGGWKSNELIKSILNAEAAIEKAKL